MKFPSLDGIDVSHALQTWQNPDHYIKALLLFSRDYADVAADLTRLVLEGDIDAAHRIAHTLKGVSGNLSITEVYNAATRINNTLREKGMDDVMAQIPDLAAALDTAVDAIRQLNGLQKVEKVPKKEMDMPHLTTLFIEMLSAFDQYSPGVIGPFLVELGAYFSQEQLSPIERYMEQFDFDGAKQETINLAKRVQIDLEAHDGKR